MAIEVSSVPDTTASLEPLQKIDAYVEWQKSEGAPIVSGFYIEDLNTLDLGPWQRKGGTGAIVNLEGTGGVNDMHVVEISPGGASAPERHIYEAMIYILSGRGSHPALAHRQAQSQLRVGSRQLVRGAHQCQLSHLQQLGCSAGALRRGDQCPDHCQPVPQPR